MKKILLFSFILITVVFLLVYKKTSCSDPQAKIYFINNKNYCLLTADNRDEWEKGLMDKKKPVNFDGMIFIFPNKEIKSFWNKNTYMDLDVYWMDGNRVTGKSFLPSILESKEIIFVESSQKVDRVVEIIR